MSSSINGTTIKLTRGDTLRLKINLSLGNEEYTPVQGDSIRFALKRADYKDTQPLILKNVPIDTMILELQPQDTKPLEFGQYVYDLQITFADGRVDTFIPEAKFRLTPEVH